MNLLIQRSSKKTKEPEMWNEKKKPLKGAFYYNYFHSITPSKKSKGGK